MQTLIEVSLIVAIFTLLFAVVCLYIWLIQQIRKAPRELTNWVVLLMLTSIVTPIIGL